MVNGTVACSFGNHVTLGKGTLWTIHTGGGWSGWGGGGNAYRVLVFLEPATNNSECGNFLTVIAISSFDSENWNFDWFLPFFSYNKSIFRQYFMPQSAAQVGPLTGRTMSPGSKRFALFPFFLKYFMKMWINYSLSHIFQGTLHIFLGPLVDSGIGAVSPCTPPSACHHHSPRDIIIVAIVTVTCLTGKMNSTRVNNIMK